MDERARNKRKLREMQAEDDADSQEEELDDELDLDVEKEKPGEGLKKKVEAEESAAKKPKLTEEGEERVLTEKAKAKLEKKAAKKAKKEEEKAGKKGKKTETEEAQPAEDASNEPAEDDEAAAASVPAPAQTKAKKHSKKAAQEAIRPSTEEDPSPPSADANMEPIHITGLVHEDAPSTSAASTPHSPVFDTAPPNIATGKLNPSSVDSAATSIASAVAPSEKPKHIKLPTDTTALRARLAAKIEQLRAARKASASDGKPIRTRQELIEERRAKQAQRKAHKKELRLKAKAEEERKREEALASARNSPGGSVMSPMVGLDDDVETSFSFGRVAFADGTTLSRDLAYEKDAVDKKRKPDPKSALLKLEAQKKRLAALDEDKRKEVLEKETWLSARRKAEGEKVRDDEGLLKKAVKRKEKAKKKSEKEWKERTAGVAKGIRERQVKREENLRKRREEKGGKGKKKKAGGGGAKKKGRPGFEGSFGVGGGKRK